MDRTDKTWAKKANPLAFKAQEQRELMDLKMLEKKKKGRELAANLWMLEKKRHAPKKSEEMAKSPTSSDGNLALKHKEAQPCILQMKTKNDDFILI